jgi:hypothetical protein
MRILALVLTLFVASGAPAQTRTVTLGSPTPQVPAVDAAHQATPDQIREYFALVHLSDTLKHLMSQMMAAMKATAAPYFPDTMWQDMDASLSGFDFLSELIPIYQKHLSRDDMEGVLAFYHTDAGKHLLENQTTMTNEAQIAFRAIGQRIGEQVGKRHIEEINAAKKKYEDGLAARQMIDMNPDPK